MVFRFGCFVSSAAEPQVKTLQGEGAGEKPRCWIPTTRWSGCLQIKIEMLIDV